MTYLLAASLGGLIALVLSIPAIVFEIIERGEVKNIPLLVDVKTIFGRKLHKEEIFWSALFFHLVIGAAYGALYVLLVEQKWFVITGAPFSFVSLLVFAVCVWAFLGFIIMPVLRMGLFGRKEGRLVWLELLLGMIFLGCGVWLCVYYYQPMIF